MDPLAEHGPQWAPYTYSFNNPVFFTDPGGKWPIPFVKSDGSFGSLKEQWQFNKAIASSFWGSAYETSQFLLNPIKTAQGLEGLAQGANMLINDFEGTTAMIGDAASDFWDDLHSDDAGVRGEAWGQASFLVAEIALGSKGVSKLAKGDKVFQAARGVGKVKFPGTNPAKAPKGFEWRGKPGSTPGSKGGNWYNPKTGESLRPDLNHPKPIGPHWDYKDPTGKWWRIFSDGSNVPK